MTVTVVGIDTHVPAAIRSDVMGVKAEGGFLTVQLTVLGDNVGGTAVLKGSNDNIAAVTIASLTVPVGVKGGTVAETTSGRYYFNRFWYEFTPTGTGKIETLRLTATGSEAGDK